MPLIPEEDYINFSKNLNENFDQLSSEQKTGFAQVLQQYRDQQKELGLPLTPKFDSGEYQVQKDTNDFLKNIYSGVKNIPIPATANDVFTTDESKFKLANKEYIGHIYNKYIGNDEDYETYKNGFINDNKLTDNSELNLYNFVQKHIQDQSFVADKVKNTRQHAQIAVNSDKDLMSSLIEIQASKGSDSVYIPEYTDAYNHVKGIVDTYRSDINAFTDAMTKKMTMGETPEDDTTIKSFSDKLVNMPDEHRDTVLKYLYSAAGRKGAKHAELFNNVANEFADSFGRVFSQGYAGLLSREKELALTKVQIEGTVLTNIPDINTPELANQYLTGKLNNIISSQGTSGDIYGAYTVTTSEEGSLRELTPKEVELIKKSKQDLQKNIDITRSIRNIGQSLDPVRDNWKGYMASATGGSLALLGTAAIPGGVVVNQQLYSGANYDELRTQYPTMSPANAALVGDISSVFEAGLDQANVSFLKNLPGIKGLLTPGKSIASKILQGTGALVGTYTFENIVEAGQDISRPVAQSLLGTVAKDIPIVDWEKEWGDWYETRPQVAIGMIPLSIFGLAAGTTNKIYNDKALLKIFSNDDILQKYGITEDNRIVIRKFISDKDADGLRSALTDIQNQRDINYSNAQANRSVNINNINDIINTNDTIDHATNQGIIPKYVLNSSTNKYDAIVNNQVQATGLEKNEIGEHQQNYIKNNIDKSISFINNFITNKPVEQGSFQTSAQIIDQHNTLAKLNGLDNSSINEINTVFGNSLNQKDIMLKLANDLKDTDQTTKSNVLGQYINSIFKNLSLDVQNTLGSNTLIAKANLKNLILNKIASMVTSNTDSILFNGISPQEINISVAQKSAINTLQKTIDDRNIATKILVSNPNEDFQTNKGVTTINSLHTIINQLKSLFGVDVLFFQSSNNAEIGIEGMFDSNSNTIFLNSQNKNPFLFLMGHEFGHFVEKNHPELHTQLKDVVLSTMSSEQKDAYYKVLKKSSNSYNTDAKLEAELVSDYLGHRMLSEDFLNKLLFKDESLFKTFVSAVKKYVTNLKSKISGQRDVSNYITKPLDTADAMLINILKDINSKKPIVAARGFQSFFEDNKDITAKKINLLVNRIRDTFNSAAQMSKTEMAGLTEEQKQSTLNNYITPINENAFKQAVNEATDVINTKPLNSYQDALNNVPVETKTLPDGTEVTVPVMDNENTKVLSKAFEDTNKAFNKYRQGLHQQAGILNGAKLTNSFNESVMATAMAATNDTRSLNEVNSLTDIDKAAIIDKGLQAIDRNLVENYKQNINNTLNYYKGTVNPKIVNNLKILDTVQKALNSTNPLAEANMLLKDLYTDNGIPNLKEGNFADKLFQYNAYRYLGNTGEKSGSQYQQINKFLAGIDVNKPISFFLEDELPGLLKSAQAELSQNDTVINNKIAKNKKVLQETRNFIAKHYQETKRVISSYVDNHLTFASLLEYAFPNQNKTKVDQVLIDELNTLTALTNPTQDDLNRIEALKNQVNIGKALTPTIQKMSDDINNGFLQAHMDNNANENDLIAAVGKRSNISVDENFKIRQELYKMLSLDNGFDITINGEITKLSPAYAAYILNISDQSKFNDKLKEKGFTPDVIKTIKDKLETDYKNVNDLRKDLRKIIQKENEKTNDEYTRIYGLGTPTPNANFYPVRFKNRNIAVVSPYDNSYQSGTMNKFLDTSVDQVEEELDLNPVEQGDNLISMFNDHMIQSTHKRNLFGPLLVAKQILTDKTISDKLENAFGKSYKELLFKQLAAFETNGIRSNFLDFVTTNRVRRMLTNIAKGAMGYKVSTMLVNFTSSLNSTMDNSIPAGQIMQSYAKTLFGQSKIEGFAFQKKEIQNRITMGANSLIAMSKASSFADKPTYLKEAGNISLTPMNYFDALGGSIAASAAYDAHYSMAEKSGITDKKILDELATEGMARTINKTFQPVILSGKSSYEMNANPMLKLFTMFMSETRKTLGLELATIKTKGLISTDTARMVIANHVLLGFASFVARSAIKSLVNPPTKDDESSWDFSKMWADMLLGPLSGFLVAGTTLEVIVYKLHNLLLDTFEVDDKKIPIFSKENNIVQAGNQASSILKLPQDLEEGNMEDFFKHLDYSIKGISTLTGSSTLGGTTTIINVLEQINGATKAATGEKIMTNE